jgi:TonB family protein
MMPITQKNTDKLIAVSASIAIHSAVVLFMIIGLSSNSYIAPCLNTASSMWVSLEPGSGKAAILPAAKRADSKISSVVVQQTIAIPTISAAKEIPAQNSSVKEDKGIEATNTNNSNNFSNASASLATGNTSGIVRAKPLYGKNPPTIYPALAKLRGYEGVVLVSAEILPDGRVGNIAISKSSGYAILDQQALNDVKLWKFEPAKKAGKPLTDRIIQPMRYFLHDENSQS